VLEERAICCDDVRVRATGAGAELPGSGELPRDVEPLPAPTRVASAYFDVRCRPAARPSHSCSARAVCSEVQSHHPPAVLVQLERSSVKSRRRLIHGCDAFVHDRSAGASV